MKLRTTIDIPYLYRKGACSDSIASFRNAFGQTRQPITLANLRMYEKFGISGHLYTLGWWMFMEGDKYAEWDSAWYAGRRKGHSAAEIFWSFYRKMLSRQARKARARATARYARTAA